MCPHIPSDDFLDTLNRWFSISLVYRPVFKDNFTARLGKASSIYSGQVYCWVTAAEFIYIIRGFYLNVYEITGSINSIIAFRSNTNAILLRTEIILHTWILCTRILTTYRRNIYMDNRYSLKDTRRPYEIPL